MEKDDCSDDPANECLCESWNKAETAVGVPLLYYGLVGLLSPVHAVIAPVGGAIALGLTMYC